MNSPAFWIGYVILDLCVYVFYRDQTAAEGKEKNAGIDGKYRSW